MSVSTALTWLFVPGDRPERFGKAAAAGADEVVLDLEDAVAAPDKDAARSHVARWLRTGGRGWVRIDSDADLAAIADAPGLAGVMVPKAEDPARLGAIAARLPADAGLVALVETALGLHRVDELVRVADRIAFGAIDFALDIDAHEADDTLLYARSRLVLASRVAGLPAPVDGVSAETRDPAAVLAAARRSRGLGFGGKLCIHPSQLAPVAEAFAPTAEEIDWARRVLAAAAGAGAVSVDGMMIDRPVLARAGRIAATARS